MIQLYYVKTGGYPIDQLANAVSTHLNFLGTDTDKIKLSDVSKITVEGVDQCTVPPEIYDEFRLLREENAVAAALFRRKLVQQRILSAVISNVYEYMKSKMDILSENDENKPTDSILVAISDILRDNDSHMKAILEVYGGRYHLEKRAKNVFEQVASPRLDDLSLSQAMIGANLQRGFTDAEAKRVAMHKELLEAIRNPKSS